MKKIFEMIKKYREIILYLIFGALTTVVSIGSYALLTRFILADFMLSSQDVCIMVSSVLSWILSVVFAYITNRLWVFKSKKSIFIEIIEFFGGRFISLMIDLFIMWLFATILGLNDMAIKILSNVVVIIFNYIASKFVIFRKKSDNSEKENKAKD